MIIREQGDKLILITQPNHAEIAGGFAGHWKVTAFSGYNRLEEVLFAIHEHDHCWEKADHAPLLNQKTGIPYSFDDYPERLKIDLYRNGIDEMEEHHPYAALLCSRHFASFFASDPADLSQKYFNSENRRQHKLIKQLNIKGKEMDEMEFHFRLLQFCDNLSLFICLNEEGKNQHPWFKKGFPNSEKLGLSPRSVKASWKDPGTVKVTPSPFDEPFTIRLKYRSIPFPIQDQETLNRLWKGAKVQTQEVRLS